MRNSCRIIFRKNCRNKCVFSFRRNVSKGVANATSSGKLSQILGLAVADERSSAVARRDGRASNIGLLVVKCSRWQFSGGGSRCPIQELQDRLDGRRLATAAAGRALTTVTSHSTSCIAPYTLQGGPKKWGHRLMTIILPNLNRLIFFNFNWKIPW